MKRLVFASLCILAAFSFAFCAPNSALASGPLMNDVGDGALIWGTSSERTTYLRPYNSYMAPEIRRIPEDLSGDPLDRENRRDLWKYANEVGTVIGTDGKIYRYHYERGVEPRRVVERRVIDGQEQYVRRIKWEPVLIRVLEPAEGVSSANSNGEGSLAPCAPNAALPKPCAPNGPNDESNVQKNSDPSVPPSLGNAEPNQEAGVPDPTAPGAQNNGGQNAASPQAGAVEPPATSAAVGTRNANGEIVVSVTTRDVSQRGSNPAPILTLPKRTR